MRKPRIVGSREVNYYHVMSRVVNRDYILGDLEKEFFLRTMRKLEAFTGVKILTYCLMSNHFHILVEVSSPEALSDEIILSRIHGFYSKSQAKIIMRAYEEAKQYENEYGCSMRLNEWRQKYAVRMGNLSSFVKELKERFSKWYNRRNNRRGTLWEERFKSVLVENSDHAITTMAAYIDLNPVRAGLVDAPRDYRFCGYAEAVAGGQSAREGIECILSFLHQTGSWRQVSAKYRSLLFAEGSKSDTKRGFNPEEIREVLENGGQLSAFELLRCHVRYFNDGVALGSRLFIEKVFEENRQQFSQRRQTGARKIRGSSLENLCTLRDLRLHPISVPAG